MAAPRPFGTCFLEQYAQISFSALLGSERPVTWTGQN